MSIQPDSQTPDVRQVIADNRKAVNEFLTAKVTEAIVKEFAERFRLSADLLQPNIQKIIEKGGETDWQSIFTEMDDAATAVAECGWTIVAWVTPREFYELSARSCDELDEFFTEGFMADKGRELSRLESDLRGCAGLLKWQSLLSEIFVSIRSGLYRVAIPAILTVIEGFINSTLVSQSIVSEKATGVVSSIERAGWHTKGPQKDYFVPSAYRFICKLFSRSDFTQDEPSFLNRHWILHGRASTEWGLADALRLVNALQVLVWVSELNFNTKP